MYPWSDLPLWAPTTDDYFMEISNAKALAAGFNYTPFTKTDDNCLDWHKKYGDPDIVFGQGDETVGLNRERELEVIRTLNES